MRRRDLISIAASAAVLPLAAGAQQKTMPRVGLLHPNSLEQGGAWSRDEFREGLRSLGWIEGRTVSIEYRFANGDPALLSANAADLVAAKVDVIVAFSGFAAQAAREATSSIPIVMDTGDPVGMGLVASLARPECNVTGLSWMSLDVVAKQLEILKEAVPRVTRSASYYNPTMRVTRSWRQNSSGPPRRSRLGAAGGSRYPSRSSPPF